MAAQLYRKLKLLDKNELVRLIEKRLRDYNPNLTALAKTQNELNDTLNMSNITPEEKIALYQATQQRFKTLQEPLRFGHSPPTTTNTSSTLADPLSPTSTHNQSINEEADVMEEDIGKSLVEQSKPDVNVKLLSSSPVASHTRAASSTTAPTHINLIPSVAQKHNVKYTKLTQLLSNYPEKLTVNPINGEAMIDGASLTGSNYADLISNLFAHHGNYNLVGQTKFLETLNSIFNSPNEYVLPSSIISNKKVLDTFHQPSPFKTKTQSGDGRKRNSHHYSFSSHPPGKKVKILYLYRM